jgi:hypothetical protein
MAARVLFLLASDLEPRLSAAKRELKEALVDTLA